MHTSLRLISTVTINAAPASGTAIDVSSILGGVSTYYLKIISTTTVALLQPGTSSETALSAFRCHGNAVYGPFRADDGSYRLWCASTTECTVGIVAVTGEN